MRKGPLWIEDENGCWIWQRCISSAGYGQQWDPRAGRVLLAHRMVYEAYAGPIPPGLSLDHLCRVTYCVRPDHLEPVTHRVNMQRGIHASKLYCVKGHPLFGPNLRIRRRGSRECITCIKGAYYRKYATKEALAEKARWHREWRARRKIVA